MNVNEETAALIAEARNPWFAAYGDWGAAGFEIKQAFRESARAALEAATPERAAALTAIERVRVLHPVAYSGNSRSRNAFCATCTTMWPCATLAALDGAPEPEGRWEYGVEVVGDVAIRKREIAERACASTDYATLVRRRPAGPWLPVEGESND